MILPDMKKLYEPYSNDASLETTLAWFKREALKRGISDEVRDAATMEVFLEMAQGKVFPLTCDCGCDLKWSSAAMNHYTLKKMLSMHNVVAEAASKALGDHLSAAIMAYVQSEDMSKTNGTNSQNKASLLDWKKSPTLNIAKTGLKWIGLR